MSINLKYPIKETYQNLVFKEDRNVVAYYRIPNTPITITDDKKKIDTKLQLLK